MKTLEFNISGMNCGHCVMAVKKALLRLPVTIKDVKVGSAQIEYDESKINEKAIETVIEEAGYKVI